MKIFAIHKSADLNKVEEIKKKISENSKVEMLILKNTNKAWKIEAKKLINKADIAIYFVGDENSNSIDWEIKMAEKCRCEVILVKLNEEKPLLQKYCKERYDNDSVSQIEEPKYTLLSQNDLKDYLISIDNQINTTLFNILDEDNEKFFLENMDYFLEQYKIFLESTERHVDRRQQLTSVYMTVVTALIPVIIFMLSSDSPVMVISTIAISLIDIFLALSWVKMIGAYGKVSSSKYEILQRIEKRLPLSILHAEWKHLSRKEQNYISFTKREQVFPYIFICINIALSIIAIALFFNMVI